MFTESWKDRGVLNDRVRKFDLIGIGLLLLISPIWLPLMGLGALFIKLTGIDLE